MKPPLAALVRALVATWVAMYSVAVFAITPDSWNSGVYAYRDAGSTLDDVLSSFARSMGVTLRLTDGVNSGARWMGGEQSDAVTPAGFLDRLAVGHGLQYFVFNNVLYVSPAARASVERIRLNSTSLQAAKEALIGLGLFEPRFGWGEAESDDGAAVIIAGPPTYARLVRQMLGHADAVPARREEPVLMVFRLKYANADDADITVRDRTVKKPGVAAILRSTLAGDTCSQSDSGPSPSEAMAAQLQAFLATQAQGVPMPAPRANRSADRNQASAACPSVQAYAPLNAVLVRDVPARRQVYQSAIDALDIPARQIEIRAEIIDADLDSLAEWSAQFNVGSLQTQVMANPSAGDPSAGAPTVSLWWANRLDLGIHALESRGSAKILARPSVLTLDNEAAVLDLSQTASYRLVGERAVDLKSVTVGTLLQVTPRLVNEEPGSPIRLQIQLEDGSFKSPGPADGPLVVRGSLDTSAVVQPGQALVIGGYRRREVDNTGSHVPVLSKLPLIGRLFQADSNSDTTSERLLVITAQALPDHAPAPAPASPALQDRLRPEVDPAQGLR